MVQIIRCGFLIFLGTLFFCACQRKTGAAIFDKQLSTIKLVKIDEEKGKVGPCEPTIYVSPKDPSKIAAGSILDRFYFSGDGGHTWETSRLKSPFGVYGDPVVIMDTQNRIYYAHLSNPANKAYQSEEFLDRIVVQRSDDFGKTWTEGTFPPSNRKKDHDKHWLAVDPSTGDILMTWTEFDKYGSKDPNDKSRILFSVTKDAAETWSPAISMNQLEGNCIDDSYTTEGAVPAVGTDGAYYVVWSYGENLYFDRSTDQGKTWLSKDIIVANQPGGWSYGIPGLGRCNGMPILKVDHSNGPNRGTLYVNWSDQRNGTNDTDIWLSTSKDGGLTWSAPKKVNGEKAPAHQFFTWMDIDQSTGYLYFVYYDRRGLTDTWTNVYLAYSTDGGKTFHEKKLNDAPFKMEENVFFGDYNNISAHQGIVRPIWTQQDGKTLSVWTAILDLK